MLVVLGLGSNISNRMEYLTQAVRCLCGTIITAMELSPIYESHAVLPDKAPESWDMPFLNMAVRGETHLAPETLLQHVKYIEHKLGRQPRGEWGPREIDIDILVYEDQHIHTNDLTIPHRHLCHRPFALVPLADVAPNWRFPDQSPCRGKTAYELALAHRNSPEIRQTDLTIERRREPVAEMAA